MSEPLYEPDPAELSDDGSSSSDDEAELAAWGYHLSSSDEEEEQEEEEEEEEEQDIGGEDERAWGYESDLSEDEVCWNADGGDYIGPYIEKN